MTKPRQVHSSAIKDENQSSQHLYSIGQLVGITITSSTLATHVLKRKCDPWYAGKVCTIPSNHTSNLADLAKNKRHSQKYGHVLSKLVIMTPWWALCVDLIKQYTLKGKDNTSINFMCLTMIDPATSWFKDNETTNCHKIDCPQYGQG